MVLTLVLLPALVGTLGGKTDGGEAGLPWLLLIIPGRAAVFVVLVIFGGRRMVPWALKRITASGSRELLTLVALTIVPGIAYGLAVLLEVFLVLDASLTGMILNEPEFSHETAKSSLPLRGVFVVLLFVSVGMLFNPMVLLQEPLTVLITFLAIVFGKSVAAYLVVRTFGHPNDIALVIAASLAQIGELSLTLIGLGIGLELVLEQSHDLMLAGAILLILVNPLLFIAIDRPWQRKEQCLAEAASRVRGMSAQDLLPPILGHEHVVLIGHGQVGGLIGARLCTTGTSFVVVVGKRDKTDELREQGYSVVLGNAANPGMLELANIAKARWLLITIPNGFEAGQIASHARAVNPLLNIVARTHFGAEAGYLEQNGVSLVIMGEREIAYGTVHRLGLDYDGRGAGAPLSQSV